MIMYTGHSMSNHRRLLLVRLVRKYFHVLAIMKKAYPENFSEIWGTRSIFRGLKFSVKWHFWSIIPSNTNIENHWKQHCVLSMYYTITSMNCSSLDIKFLEILVPKVGQSNCAKSKQRLFWPFWPAITSQNNFGMVSYFKNLFYGIVLWGNCNCKLVECILCEE